MTASRRQKPNEPLPELIAKFWRQHSDAILNYGGVPNSDHLGIGGNTLRAYGDFAGKTGRFKRYGKTPIKLKLIPTIEAWCKKVDVNHGLADCNFSDFHKQQLQVLVETWHHHQGAELPSYPYGTKLLDLRMKHLAWRGVHHGVSPEIRRRLLYEAYQPLDRWSLALLRALAVRLRSGKVIPSLATMGIVSDWDEYEHLQSSISSTCALHDIPRFAFDFFAWNMRLPGQK